MIRRPARQKETEFFQSPRVCTVVGFSAREGDGSDES
jgi:hypothetical protein